MDIQLINFYHRNINQNKGMSDSNLKDEKLQINNEYFTRTQSNSLISNINALGIPEREILLQVKGTQKKLPDNHFMNLRRSADMIEKPFKTPNYDNLYMLKSDKFLKSFFKNDSNSNKDIQKWIPRNKLPAPLFNTKMTNRAKTEFRTNNSPEFKNNNQNDPESSARLLAETANVMKNNIISNGEYFDIAKSLNDCALHQKSNKPSGYASQSDLQAVYNPTKSKKYKVTYKNKLDSESKTDLPNYSFKYKKKIKDMSAGNLDVRIQKNLQKIE